MAYQKSLNRAGFISHPRGGSQLRTQELPCGSLWAGTRALANGGAIAEPRGGGMKGSERGAGVSAGRPRLRL